jgi:tetratricopeptide (TPR) repeat protein
MLAVPHVLPASEPALYHKARGDYHYRRGEIPAAIVHYQTCLRKTPGFPECHFMLGTIYLEQEQYHFAMEQLQAVLTHRAGLTDKTLVLDTYFLLAKTHFKADPLKKDPDAKSGLERMDNYIDKVIAAFSEDPDFRDNKRHRYTVNRHYYLAKAYFIKARYMRDMKQAHVYKQFFELSLQHLKYDLENYFPTTVFEKGLDAIVKQLQQLRTPQPAAWKRAAWQIDTISYCLFFLWEYNHHRGNHTLAARYRDNALLLNPQIFRMPLDSSYFMVLQPHGKH